MPTASLRGLLWGIDGHALIVGTALLALSRPRPFFAYPFLAATLVGWALHHFREAA